MGWAEGQKQKQSKAKGMAEQGAGGVSSKEDWMRVVCFLGGTQKRRDQERKEKQEQVRVSLPKEGVHVCRIIKD